MSVFNFDRFFADIHDRYVILKFGNASSEKQHCSDELGISISNTITFP